MSLNWLVCLSQLTSELYLSDTSIPYSSQHYLSMELKSIPPPSPRLATSRLANIFGNGTMYRHDKKKTEKGRNPRNKPNIPNKPSAEGTSELRAHQNRKSCEGLCESLLPPVLRLSHYAPRHISYRFLH